VSAPPPAESVEEALQRASTHARKALAEAVAACRALLDVVSLLAIDAPAPANRRLASLARILDDLTERLAPVAAAPDDASASLLLALADALDEEIARWEERARSDREARAVLRAFLGMREILWELGVRTAPSAPPPAAAPRSDTRFDAPPGPAAATAPQR